MNSTNILFDARWIAPNRTGVGNFCFHFLHHLPLKKANYFFIVNESPDVLTLENMGTLIYTQANLTRHPRTEFFEQFIIPWLCHKYRCDAFVSFEGRVPLFHMGFKTFSLIHDISTWTVRKSHNLKYSVLMYANLMISKYFASTVLTVSKTVQSQLVKKINIPEKKIKVIHPADSQLQTLFQKEIKPLVGKVFFLTVGVTNSRKNLKQVVQAMGSLVEDHPDVYLGVTGNQQLIDSERPQNFQNILNLGFVTNQELAWLYSHCRAVIIASKEEGFGIPLVDAFQFQKPVICSDIPVFREVLGDKGTFFRLGNVSELVNHLKSSLSQKKPEIDYNLPFSWSSSVNKLLQVMEVSSPKKWLFDITALRPDTIARGIPKVIEDMLMVVMEAELLFESAEFIVEKKYEQFINEKYPALRGKLFVVKNNLLRWPVAVGFLSKLRYRIPKNKYLFVFLPQFTTLNYNSNTPQVVVIHDLIIKKYWKEYLFDNASLSNTWLTFFSLLKMGAIKNASHYVCVSNYTKSDIINTYGVDPDRADVIKLSCKNMPNSIIHSKINEAILKLPEKQIILYVGGFDYRKNIGSMIKEIGPFAAKNNCQLVLAGAVSKKDKERYVQLSVEVGVKNSTKIFDCVSEMELTYLYSIAKVFVFCSKAEGFGLPLIEAMSQKVPVVAFSNTSVTEVVEGAGILVENGNFEQFRAEIQKLFKSPERMDECIAKGLKRASKYSNETFKESFIKILSKLINPVSD